MKRSLHSQYRKLGCLCTLQGKLCSKCDKCSAVNYENVTCSDYLGNFSCISLHHWKPPARIPCFSVSILVCYKLVKMDRVVKWFYLLTNILLYSFGKHSIRVSKGLTQQAEVAQGVPGRLRPRIFLTFGTTRVVGRQPYAPAAFTSGQIPGTHF